MKPWISLIVLIPIGTGVMGYAFAQQAPGRGAGHSRGGGPAMIGADDGPCLGWPGAPGMMGAGGPGWGRGGWYGSGIDPC